MKMLSKYNDVRLFRSNKGDIYCYDGLITSIYQIKVVNGKIIIPAGNFDTPEFSGEKIYFKNKLCSMCNDNDNDNEKGCFIKKFDKNWSMINIVKKNKIFYFEFINWFTNGIVIFSYLNMKNGHCHNENKIVMKGDKIEGLGSRTLPMFSLGTNFIEIKRDKDNMSYCGIGVGHIKIIKTTKYTSEKIIKFIENLKIMNKEEENFIGHNSYSYLCYF
jgi:hypothetical protein